MWETRRVFQGAVGNARFRRVFHSTGISTAFPVAGSFVITHVQLGDPLLAKININDSFLSCRPERNGIAAESLTHHAATTQQ